jgi:rare lipoprotein A (peptidoglycan hydrolase)
MIKQKGEGMKRILFIFVILSATIILKPLTSTAQRPEGRVHLTASWYYAPGKLMANGSVFFNGYTCAANRYPLGAVLMIEYRGKTIHVKVTDRTARKYGHRIDLTRFAFSQLAPLSKGIIKVNVRRAK